MKKIIVILIVLGLGWYGNQKYRTNQQKLLSDTSETIVANSEPDASSNSSQFKCDGRTHCSQMISCEEATFFINNCPGTKMDGNQDGIPCERQWCQ